MPEPAIGRIVHYVLEDGPAKGHSRPGQITSVFPQPEGPALLNLVVTLDGVNDRMPFGEPHQHMQRRHADETEDEMMTHGPEGGYALHVWRTSVTHAEEVGTPPTYVPGTWHWPPGVS